MVRVGRRKREAGSGVMSTPRSQPQGWTHFIGLATRSPGRGRGSLKWLFSWWSKKPTAARADAHPS